MSAKKPKVQRFELFLQRIGAQPVSFGVFLASALLLTALHLGNWGRIRAVAVADGPVVEHPAPAGAVVEKVFVRPGDHVTAGTPLMTLSSHFLAGELARLDAEIEALSRESQVEQLKLADEERMFELSMKDKLGNVRSDAEKARALQLRQAALVAGIERQVADVERRHQERLARDDELRESTRLLEQEKSVQSEAKHIETAEIARLRELEKAIRARGGAPMLSAPTAHMYESRVNVLKVQRDAMAQSVGELTIKSRATGRVAHVLQPGSTVATGLIVVSVVPDAASEIVAYLPPTTNPALLAPGTEVVLNGPTLSTACTAPAHVLRRGAMVQQAPMHLGSLLRTDVFGLPVYTSIPEGCKLGVGQTLQVELARATP